MRWVFALAIVLIVLAGGLFMLGLPPFAQPAATPPRYSAVSYTFDDWVVTCRPTSGKPACHMAQQIIDGDSGRALAALTFWSASTTNADRLQITAPLGVWLQPGVNLIIGGEARLSLKYRQCLKAGCFAETEIDDALRAAFSTAQAGQIQIHNRDRQRVNIAISGRGFFEARGQLTALGQMNAAGGSPEGSVAFDFLAHTRALAGELWALVFGGDFDRPVVRAVP